MQLDGNTQKKKRGTVTLLMTSILSGTEKHHVWSCRPVSMMCEKYAAQHRVSLAGEMWKRPMTLSADGQHYSTLQGYRSSIWYIIGVDRWFGIFTYIGMGLFFKIQPANFKKLISNRVISAQMQPRLSLLALLSPAVSHPRHHLIG